MEMKLSFELQCLRSLRKHCTALRLTKLRKGASGDGIKPSNICSIKMAMYEHWHGLEFA